MPTVAQIVLTFTAFRALTLITTPPLPPTSQNTTYAPLSRFPSVHALSFLSHNQIFFEVETEAEVTVILFIKLIIGETNAGGHLAGCMRVARDGYHAWVRFTSTVLLISGALADW
jgi:hypothetical protein